MNNHMSNYVTPVQLRNCLCRVVEMGIGTETEKGDGDMKREQRMELVRRYGGFRVVRRDCLGKLHHYTGDGTWNELDATQMEGDVQAAAGPNDEVWIEHQDPETKEWRRW